ncbi:MAG: NusA-like transcription termination signal-binding factor [Candidatus Woesearchaeota archaeon]
MKLDVKLIGYVNTFEKYTRVNAKDCFFDKDKVLVFVVNSLGLGKAVGKQGVNARNLSLKLKQRVRIIGFSEDPCGFVKNLLYPLKGFEVVKEEGKILIKTEDRSLKGKVYGRDRTNLKNMNEIFRRYFRDMEIVVE